MDKGRQRKTGLAGKKHWFEKKVLKKQSSDVVLTQNEKGTGTVQCTEAMEYVYISRSVTKSVEIIR